MAVLRSKRKIAQTEFENTFTKLYQFSMRHTTAVPKRRKKWLCRNIDDRMNLIYKDIMAMNDCYNPDATQKAKYIEDLNEACIHRLVELEKPLMVLWNVQSAETKHMAAWVELLNREIFLLNLMRESKVSVPEMAILDWRAVNSVKFLKNMSELHRYTHSKVTNANMDYDATQGSLLIELVNDAFYYLILANKKIPTTRKQYENRRDNISRSISCLKALNREMLFYFNLMQYSERVMNEWTSMLTQEIKMLSALQKSDRERFESLK